MRMRRSAPSVLYSNREFTVSSAVPEMRALSARHLPR